MKEDSQELRDMLSKLASSVVVDRFFEKDKIAKQYTKVRSIDTVEKYYQGALDEIKLIYRGNYLAKNILEDPEIQEYNEKIIKTILFNLALVRMIVDESTTDMEVALMMELTEKNVLRAIDKLQENLEETLKEFFAKIVHDTIFRVGLKFVD